MSGLARIGDAFETAGTNRVGALTNSRDVGDEELEPSRLRRAQAEQVELCTKAQYKFKNDGGKNLAICNA